MAEALFARIIIVLVGTPIASLLGAVLLRAAAKWVASLEVAFGKAYGTVFIAYLLTWGIELMVAIAGAIAGVEDAVLRFIIVPVSFCIQACVIGSRLSVTFGKALLINLVMVAIGIGIVVIATLIAFGMWQIIW